MNQSVKTAFDGLVQAIRAEVMDEMYAAISGDRGRAAPASKARAAAAPRSGGLAKGQKRDPKVIAAMLDSLKAYVFGHPGERIEQIAKGMGVSTRELNLPVKKLIKARLVRTVGEKRSTKYFPKAKR